MEPADPRYAEALRKIESLERENKELQKRLERLGTDHAALRNSRAIASGERFTGRAVVAGLTLVIVTVFSAAMFMYFQLRNERPSVPVQLPAATAAPSSAQH